MLRKARPFYNIYVFTGRESRQLGACTLTTEYGDSEEHPRFRPRGRAAGQGRHDIRKERATNPGTDGAAYSIAPQAMTGSEDNDTSPQGPAER